jgi:hypothetical protein
MHLVKCYQQYPTAVAANHGRTFSGAPGPRSITKEASLTPFCFLSHVQIALNTDIYQLWLFWDQKKMFSDWNGVARKFYLSAAATCAGWVSCKAAAAPDIPKSRRLSHVCFVVALSSTASHSWLMGIMPMSHAHASVVLLPAAGIG